MSEFRLIQVSDPHLTRRHPTLTDNFHRISEHIDAKRPDLVVNSGDLAFDAPTSPKDLEFAKSLHAALPVACRYLPGNHDVGDNPTAIGPVPSHPTGEARLQAYRAIFGEDHWSFEAAGWCMIGLNSLVMNTGLAAEAEQFDWLASQLSGLNGKPLALFIHKPLFLNKPDDPEMEASAIRYVPQPARAGSSRCSRRSIAVWSRAATSTSAAISPFATPATSGRPRPVSLSPTPGRK